MMFLPPNSEDSQSFPTAPVSANAEQWKAFVEQIESRVVPGLATPSITSAVLAALGLNAIRAVPRDVVTPERVGTLLAIAKFNYLSGSSMTSIDPAVEAVWFARELGDKLWLTRALHVLAMALGESVDTAASIEFFREALDLAIELRNVKAESAIWQDLGAALLDAGQYEDAMRCFGRTLQLCDQYPDLSSRRPIALMNCGLACLHKGDTAQGIRSLKKALDFMEEPVDQNGLLNRTLAETYYVRLLLDIPDHRLARERCALANVYAERSASSRARLAASIASSLVDVSAGRADVGLTRLTKLLEQARVMRTEYRDALYALITAHQYLGDHSKAEPYVRELMLYTRSVQHDYLSGHHRALLQEQMRPVKPLATTFGGELRLAEEETPQWQRLERMALAAALRLDPTGEHPFRVGKLAALMAQAQGLPEIECRKIELAGRIHDIGIAALPETSFGERADSATFTRQRLRRHTELGAELLEIVPLELAQFSKEVAISHHECYDGSGYPMGLLGQDIPLAARLIAVANAFDTMTHPGPVKNARSVDRALDELIQQKRKRFDPEAVDLCVAVIRRLVNEVPDLDEYLAKAAEQSPLIAARKRIHNLLSSPIGIDATTA